MYELGLRVVEVVQQKVSSLWVTNTLKIFIFWVRANLVMNDELFCPEPVRFVPLLCFFVSFLYQ